MGKLDPKQCKKIVWHRLGNWGHDSQCLRKPKRDGYCWQHHPDAVEQRRQESDKRYRRWVDNSPEMKMHRRITALEAENTELLTIVAAFLSFDWVGVIADLDGVPDSPEHEWFDVVRRAENVTKARGTDGE